MKQLSLLLFCISLSTSSAMHHSVATHQAVTVRDILQLGTYLFSKCWQSGAVFRANEQSNFKDTTAERWLNHAKYYQAVSDGLPSYHPWYNAALEINSNHIKVALMSCLAYTVYKAGRYAYDSYYRRKPKASSNDKDQS